MYRKIIAISFILFHGISYAQKYPVNYFRSPLNIPLLLAGNFGECRPNHFHSGIDIKTNGSENLPVFAVADGYVSRIKMEPGGFGHALYVTHPNGYTSLYAHLNNFAEDIQRYVKTEQYKNESWTLDLQLQPSQFPVKKGQQIAWSGNTGSSTAPHLHFEIRENKTEHPLNPQLFGFEIKDNVAPVPAAIAVYNATQSIYEQKPERRVLRKSGAIYYTDTIHCNSPRVGIGLSVNDFMNGSENTLTFYTAQLYMDSVLFGTVTLDDIGYDVTRYQHAYIDYSAKKLSGQYIQLLFQLKGNILNTIYDWQTERGVLTISDRQPHKIDIALQDASGNKTAIKFYVRQASDSVSKDCATKLFKANEANHFEMPNIKLTLNEKAIYDDVCFQFNSTKDINSYSDRYGIHKHYVPVHSYFELMIKPNKAVSFSHKDKIAMMYSDGNDESGKAAVAEGAWYKASVRNFGEYRLVIDTVPPVINSIQKNNAALGKAAQIRFLIKDAVTSVKRYRAEIDGRWVCMEQHGDVFFYNFDGYCPKGKHKLVLKASDENNNTSTFTLNFTR